MAVSEELGQHKLYLSSEQESRRACARARLTTELVHAPKHSRQTTGHLAGLGSKCEGGKSPFVGKPPGFHLMGRKVFETMLKSHEHLKYWKAAIIDYRQPRGKIADNDVVVV